MADIFIDLKINIYCSQVIHTCALKGGRPKVRDVTLEIGDMFVSYSISPKPLKLSFKTE